MNVKLTPKEAEMLTKIARSKTGYISVLVDKPNTRVANSLVAKGLAKNVMDTFYHITDAGKELVAASE